MSESTEERPSCRCLRTHCLQLHCSFFRAAYFCSNNCECHDCRNSEHCRTYAEEHYELAQKKNPKALAFKAPIVEETTQAPATVQEGDGGTESCQGVQLSADQMQQHELWVLQVHGWVYIQMQM